MTITWEEVKDHSNGAAFLRIAGDDVIGDGCARAELEPLRFARRRHPDVEFVESSDLLKAPLGENLVSASSDVFRTHDLSVSGEREWVIAVVCVVWLAVKVAHSTSYDRWLTIS